MPSLKISASIADNWITSLYFGKDGTLWIGTLSKGLCQYEPRSGKFSNYGFDPIPIDSPARQRPDRANGGQLFQNDVPLGE